MSVVAELSGDGPFQGQLRGMYMAAAPLTTGSAFLRWAQGRRQLECSALGSCPGSASAEATLTHRCKTLLPAKVWQLDRDWLSLPEEGLQQLPQ